MGKLLRVDLTTGALKDENLPREDLLMKYVGGTGLGVRLLYDEVRPGTYPTDSENLLIFMTGPLTGTPALCSSNSTCVTLNFEVPYMVGTAHSHGFFGPYLKFAGYDGIVIKGVSEKPVYLTVFDDQVQLVDAKKFWGKDTHETEDLIKKEYATRKAPVSVACIGPAGENLCAGAFIANDHHHSYAKCGVGTVMGSKRLKAIAVSGSLKVPLADRQSFMEQLTRWKESLFKPKSFAWWVKQWYAGAPGVQDYKKVNSLIGYKNFSTADDTEWQNMMADMRAGKTAKIKPKACYNCPIACSYEVEITSGPYKGLKATPSGGGENIEGAAGMIGVHELGAVYHLMELYDRYGLDSSTAGCAISLAFECYQKGLLTAKDTGGIELNWGDDKAAEQLLNMYVKKEGLGKVLALGPKRAAEMIGQKATEIAVHIKGMGINLHDWRPTWGILLGQIVASAGPRWEGIGVDTWATEPDVGYKDFQEPVSKEGKPLSVRMTSIKKLWEDCLGVCWFAAWGVPGSLDFIPKALGFAVGREYEKNDALMVGERTINLERVFAIRRGFTPLDDFDIGPRLLEPPDTGKGAGRTIEPYLKGLVSEYYRLMGWDEKTGKPWRKILERLGMEDLIKDIWQQS